MNRWFAPGLLLIAGLALALRLPELDRRPMHNDEGVNAMRFRSLWASNTYQYDPNEFHGPTLEYSTVPSAWLSASHDFNSFTESTFRRVTVTFGVGLILLLFLLADALGKLETLWAAGLTAISPAMVFYSRYYIHEMLLVLMVFFSSFFTNFGGLIDSLKTFLIWLPRAGGASPHIHSWYFYFRRLVFFHYPNGPFWSEALIVVLAVVGFVAVLTRRWQCQGNVTFMRIIVFYTAGLTLIYT